MKVILKEQVVFTKYLHGRNTKIIGLLPTSPHNKAQNVGYIPKVMLSSHYYINNLQSHLNLGYRVVFNALDITCVRPDEELALMKVLEEALRKEVLINDWQRLQEWNGSRDFEPLAHLTLKF